MKRKIGVIFGGTSREHEVSLNSGKTVLNSLDTKKYEIIPVKIEKNGKWTIGKNKPKEELEALKILKKKIDVAFIALHGTKGEDGTIQGLLEFLDIPYTGSNVEASALAMDKEKSAEIFKANDLTVPKSICITRKNRKTLSNIQIPCIVKPADNGSSVGITLVRKKEDLKSAIDKALKISERVLVQEYIKGDEVTCAVLDDGKKIKPLTPTHIIPKSSVFFDYHAKYTHGATEEVTPPRLPANTVKQIQKIAVEAHSVLGCSGVSRTDMIIKGKKIFILETNTIPGMTKTSLMPQAAAHAGISFSKLLDILIESATKNHNS